MICLKCKQDRAHRSHRNGWWDWAMGFAGRLPYSCHACNERFFVRTDGESSRLRSHTEREIIKTRRSIRWQKTKNDLIIYGAGVLVVLGVLYFLLQESRGG